MLSVYSEPLIHTVLIVRSAKRMEAQQTDHDNTVVHSCGVRNQLAADDHVHGAHGVEPDAAHLAAHTLPGLRRVPHPRHVVRLHQPAALRLAQHQLPPGAGLRAGQGQAEGAAAEPEQDEPTQTVDILQGRRPEDKHDLLHDSDDRDHFPPVGSVRRPRGQYPPIARESRTRIK